MPGGIRLINNVVGVNAEEEDGIQFRKRQLKFWEVWIFKILDSIRIWSVVSLFNMVSLRPGLSSTPLDACSCSCSWKGSPALLSLPFSIFFSVDCPTTFLGWGISWPEGRLVSIILKSWVVSFTSRACGRWILNFELLLLWRLWRLWRLWILRRYQNPLVSCKDDGANTLIEIGSSTLWCHF